MIKHIVVGAAAAALAVIGGGIALAAHAGADGTAQPAPARAATVVEHPATSDTGRAGTAAWTWINGGGSGTQVTAAGWLDKPREDVL
ncbi:hypothetical protein [Kitasatospora sp. NPDC094011]|uniref:hypothetical protein n=1 Tax=Kitasatospora sp. NPDC094011 TaxID=3364090 RepID=UPI0037FDEEB3